MNRTKYWQNKILYALGKIDYAQSRMRRKENDNTLSRIYATLLSYGKDGCDITTLMQLAKLNRNEVVRHLKQLKDMGIADWVGRNLKESKKVKVNDVPSQKVYEGIHTKDFEEHLLGYGFDEDGVVIDPRKVPDVEAHIKAAKHDDGWVEIRYSSDVILKVKKSVVREKLLNGE